MSFEGDRNNYLDSMAKMTLDELHRKGGDKITMDNAILGLKLTAHRRHLERGATHITIDITIEKVDPPKGE